MIYFKSVLDEAIKDYHNGFISLNEDISLQGKSKNKKQSSSWTTTTNTVTTAFEPRPCLQRWATTSTTRGCYPWCPSPVLVYISGSYGGTMEFTTTALEPCK